MLEIQFVPSVRGRGFDFKAGQYVTVNIPSVNKHDWHPFTISSAPGDFNDGAGYVSIHMNVGKEGSWTDAVSKYFGANIPRDQSCVNIYSSMTEGRPCVENRGDGTNQGCYIPSERSMIRVNGPYAAPSQHHDLYRTTLLACLGIGVTPMIAG